MPTLSAKTFYAKVNEDGSFSVLARLCDLDGTGSEVRPGEGACLQQADVASIQLQIFSLGASKDNEPGTLVDTIAAVVADSILDTLRTVGWPTDSDPFGYNFRHDVGAGELTSSGTDQAGSWYKLLYMVTTTTGSVGWGRIYVQTVSTEG